MKEQDIYPVIIIVDRYEGGWFAFDTYSVPEGLQDDLWFQLDWLEEAEKNDGRHPSGVHVGVGRSPDEAFASLVGVLKAREVDPQ